MKRHLLISVSFLSISLFLTPKAHAQSNPNLEVGLRPYGSFEGGNIDSISLTNGNLNLHIPLFSYPQRGSMPGSVSLGYRGKNWYVAQHCEYSVCTDQWKWINTGGQLHGVYVNNDGWIGISYAPEYIGSSLDVFTAYTSDGGTHMMVGSAGAYYSSDGTGIFYGGSTAGGGPIRTKDGVQPLTSDNNGNLITSQYGGTTGSISSDTLGRNLSPTGTSTSDYSGCVAPASPAQISGASILLYPGQGGTNRQLKTCTAMYTATTNFNAVDPSGSPAIQEGSETATFVVSVVLYNGSSWSTSPSWGFDYDYAGDLAKVTLPTGGTISYGWFAITLCTGSTESLTQYSMAAGSRTVDAKDGTGPHQWGLGVINGSLSSASTDPDQNQTVHTFTELGACGYYETKTQWYQGSSTSGTLLKTATTDYQSQTNPYGRLLPASNVNVLPIRVTTTWANGQTTKVEKDYDTAPVGVSAGNVVALREYDYGINAPGPLLRTTTYTYVYQTNSSFKTANLLDRVASVTVTDGSGTQVSKSTYTYDDSTPIASGVTVMHDNTKANSPRGNHTGVCRWLSTTGRNVCSSTVYYDTGMPYSTTDANGNFTKFTYSTTDNGAYMTQTNFPDTTSPTLAHHVISGTYDFNTGQLNSFTDQNSQPSSYGYDLLGRIISASFPDGGSTTFTYNDVALSAYVERDEKITASATNIFRVYFDGMGRRKQTQLRSDPTGIDYVDYTYDENGRAYTISNPYRSTSDPTYGLTTHKYDPLGREITVIPPDGTATTNNVQTQYCGGHTLVTDQSKHWRRSSGDGLGRLIEVDEPNSPTATINVCPGTGEPIYATTYAYDGLNDLQSVVQNGSRNRSFTYDSFKRLTSSTNPEAGTVNYAYDSVGNVLTKTDARGTSGFYYYDALNRLIAKRFSDTTSPTYYLFDGALPSSTTATFATGSITISGTEQSFLLDCGNPPCPTIYDTGTLTIAVGGFARSVTYQHGSNPTVLANNFVTAFNFVGSTVSATSSAGTITFTALLPGAFGDSGIGVSVVGNDPNDFPTPSFTLAGSGMTGGAGTCTVTGITISSANSIGRRSGMCDAGGGEAWSFDAMGRELREQRTTSSITKNTSYTYNADGSLATLTYPTSRTITYAINAASQPVSAIDTANSINFATAASYAPQGSLSALTLGSGGSFTGLQLNDSYNTRLQPTEIKAWSTAGVAMDLVYGFVDSNSNNNGNVVQISNSKDATRSQSFTYDQLNRIGTAKTSAASGTHCWSYSYGYDAWANLLSSSPISGYSCTQSNLSLSVNTKNQITNTGFSYDASGNVLADGVTTYAWDAESHIKTAAGVNYTYDGDGNRLQKSSGKIYWYGAGSEILDESDTSGNITAEYVFFGGKRIAMLPGNSDPNGGFEQGSLNWTVGTGISIVSDSTRAHSGNNYAQVSTATAAYLDSTQYIPVTSGQQISFGGWAYRESGSSGTASWQLAVYDVNKNPIQYLNPAPSNVSTAAWTYQQATVTAPAGAAYVLLYAQVYGASSQTVARFDDGFVSLGTNGGSGILYYAEDFLGTSRVITTSNGTVCYEADFQPFGGENPPITNTCPQNYKFTGKERDSETGNDNFGARYFSPTLGRWLSPDWSAIPTPVPYATLTNPQTLNLYQYVGNNPETAADIDGHLWPIGQRDPNEDIFAHGDSGSVSGYVKESDSCQLDDCEAQNQQTPSNPAPQNQNKLTVTVVDSTPANLLGKPSAEAGAQFTVQIGASTNFTPGNLEVSADLHFSADKAVAKGTEVLVQAQAENSQTKVGGTQSPKTVNSLLVDVRPFNQTGNFGGRPNEPGYITFHVKDASGTTRSVQLNVDVVSKRIPGGLPLPAGSFVSRSVVPIPNP